MVKRNRKVPQQEEPIQIEDIQCKSLIKKLASCKQNIRDRALRTLLQTWLPEQTQISEEDMKKLWQGLFYCIWHADKSQYQSELIDRVSSVLKSLPLDLSLHYFTVFLFTMRREWSRIDRLRLDKFYLLIRRFLNGFFSVLDSSSWDLELTSRLVSVLFDGFHGNDGVNYHVVSVFLDELKPFLPLKKDVLEVLFDPFVRVLGLVSDKVLVLKIKCCLFDELLKMGKKLLDCKKSGEEGDGDVAVLGSIALSMEFSKRFYEMGSSSDCHQGNRKPIFALHKEFLQLEKDLSASGVEVSNCNNDEKVPELVSLSGETELSKKSVANGSSAKKKGMSSCDNEEEVSELVPLSGETEADGLNVVANGSSSKKKKKGLKKCSNSKKGSVKKEEAEVTDIGKKDESFDETMIMDLRQEFEKIASEMGPAKSEVASVCEEVEPAPVSTKKSKKRKRENKREEQGSVTTTVNKDETEMNLTAPSKEKSSKRVRFAMKNNLVWKPHCPLPPQDLRLPPSATPRGSALKQGIPAGPVRVLPSKSRKTKKKAKPAVRRTMKKKQSP